MGLNLICSSSENDRPRRVVIGASIVPTQPDPGNFRILRHHRAGQHTVVMAVYPDAKNYEGKKIIVYLYTSYEEIIKQQRLDPHFTSAKMKIKPFARFDPTELGWSQACKLIERIL